MTDRIDRGAVPSLHRYLCLCPLLLFVLSMPATAIGSMQMRLAGEPSELADWEQAYLEKAVARLYDACERANRDKASKPVRSRNNELVLEDDKGGRRVIQAVGGSSTPFVKLAFYEEQPGQRITYHDCQPRDVIPIAGIMEAHSLEREIPERRTRAGLTTYEPNSIGWRWDDSDVNEGYLDAVLSLKYPLFHDGVYSDNARLLNPYFAFTSRFSQYIESRDSSPVVARSYNPKLFFRHWLGDDSRYLDFGIAHESNGQRINAASTFFAEQLEFIRQGEDPEFARDYISRGWDYLSFDWKHAWYEFPGVLDTYVKLKYFLDDGPFQGEPEESNPWEGDGRNRRREFDGIELIGKYRFDDSYCAIRTPSPSFCLRKFAWLYTTGYDNPTDNNTNRLEITFDLAGLPVMLWGQTGYNSDLVDYYRKEDSWGIALELHSATLK